MMILTSRNNPKIKQIHQLLNQRKQRDATGLFVAEGIHHVGEACAARVWVEYIVYAPELLTSDYAKRLVEEQTNLGLPCYPVSADLFTGLASKDNPQGIIAVVRQPNLHLEDFSSESLKWGVALVAPQDPGNIGSILRTIDAVGASGLLLVNDPGLNQYSADPFHPNAVRASMGAIFWYPIVLADFSSFSGWARANGYHIYGTSAHAAQEYQAIEHYESPLILLMGSEQKGLSESQTSICDVMVGIPMHGRVSSLNLATATGVMLYSILGKR